MFGSFIGFAAAAVAIHYQKLNLAGSIVVALLLAIGCIQMFSTPEGYRQPAIDSLFMLVLLVAVFLLPHLSVITIASIVFCVSFVSYGLAGALQSSIQDAYSAMAGYFFLLPVAAIMLSVTREEFKRRLERVEQAQQEADRANQAKSKFMENISHELRTPLNIITGNTYLILHGIYRGGSPISQELPKSLLEGVVRNSHRLLGMVEQILDVEELMSGCIAPRYAPANISFITKTVERLRLQIDRPDVSLHMQIEESAPTILLTDEAKLTTIIVNLVANAIKFTEHGSITVRVYSPTSTTWSVEVCDTGIGIAPEHLPHIFERFYQVNPSEDRKHQGSGLGLSIAKEMTEILNGNVVATSHLAEGSIFTVTFPKLPKTGLPN